MTMILQEDVHVQAYKTPLSSSQMQYQYRRTGNETLHTSMKTTKVRHLRFDTSSTEKEANLPATVVYICYTFLFSQQFLWSFHRHDPLLTCQNLSLL